jgi:hypothetical protein
VTLATGTRLGPYEILSPLGAGGMGEVYRARDPRIGREVAVKVLPAELAADAERLRRFELEARAAGALNHPNVLVVLDVGEHGGAPYLITELLEGETLRERLDGGAMPARKAIGVAVQIARGLAAAHEKGIVHRDLKPENVFLTRDGSVKILDFGLAKVAGPVLPDQGKTLTTPPGGATGAGVVLGTAGYMSPEQVRGLPADARSDLFSLGAVLYEMLSGQRAFRRDSAVETMSSILREEPPDLDPGLKIPPSLVRVLDRCLAKDRAARFQSAPDLAFALESATLTSTSSGEAQVLQGRRYARWLPWGATVAAVLGLAWIGLGPGRAGLGRDVRVRELLKQDMNVLGARMLPGARTIFFTARRADGPFAVYSLSEQGQPIPVPGGEDAVLLDVYPNGDLLVAKPGKDGSLGSAILPSGGGTALPLPDNAVALVPWPGEANPWRIRVDRSGETPRWVFEDGARRQVYAMPATTWIENGAFDGTFRLSWDRSHLWWVERRMLVWTLAVMDRDGQVRRTPVQLPEKASRCCLSSGPAGFRASYYPFERITTVLGRVDSRSGEFKQTMELPGRFEFHEQLTNDEPLLSAESDVKEARWGKVAGGEERTIQLQVQEQVGALSTDGEALLLVRDIEEGGSVWRWDELGSVALKSGYLLGLDAHGDSALALHFDSNAAWMELLPIRSDTSSWRVPGTWVSSGPGGISENGKVCLIRGARRTEDKAEGPGFTYLFEVGSDTITQLPPEVMNAPDPEGRRTFWTAGRSWGLYDLAGRRKLLLAFEAPSNFEPRGWLAGGNEIVGLVKATPTEWELRALDLTTGNQRQLRRIQVASSAAIAEAITLKVSLNGASYAYSYPVFRPSRLFTFTTESP